MVSQGEAGHPSKAMSFFKRLATRKTWPARHVLHAILFLLLLLAAVVVYWAVLLSSYRDQAKDLELQTGLRSSQLAQTLAVQTQTLFSGLDFVAQNLAAQYIVEGASNFDLTVRTAIETYPRGAILQIALADSDGQIIYSNLQKTGAQAQTSIRDREHFLVHAQTLDSGLYISAPVLGRVSKDWTVQITRAIRVNGEFKGVVVVSVAPSFLSSFFREILDGSSDVILLLRSDGSYIARSRDEDLVLGLRIPKEQEFLVASDKQQGFYEAQPAIDGVARYYAWHRVENLPLLVSVGLDKKAVWAAWDEGLRTKLLRNAVGTVVLLSVLGILVWFALQQRRAREEAKRHAQLLRKLVEHVPGALFQMHAAAHGRNRLTYVSPDFYSLHHAEAEQVGESVASLLSLIDPQDTERLHLELKSAVEGMATLQTQYRVIDAQGGVHHLQVHAKPESDGQGGYWWHGYVHDVTHAQEVQETVRLSEERMRLTMAAVQDGIWEWHLHTDCIDWDRRCWEMLGYPAESVSLERSTMMEWMHPNDRNGFLQCVNGHLNHGQSYHYEFRLRTCSGEWCWIEARGNATGFVDGKPTRMLGTHTDISARVAREQLLRGVLDGSAAAIFVVGPDRRFVQMNQRAQSMFGSPEDSLVGQSLQVIYATQADFEGFAAFYPALREQGFVRCEWRLKFSDGSLHWCELYGTPLDAQEPLKEVIWTAVDVDERYRAAADLRMAQQRLTAIIEQFPSGVLLQERWDGSWVAMNQQMCELLKLPVPVCQLDDSLREQIRLLLPPTMLMEPTPPQAQQKTPLYSVEQVMVDGHTYEVHRIPLWEGERSLGIFWMLNDITLRKQREIKLEHLAATDTLTQLPNRRTFIARLQKEWTALQDGLVQPSVLLMVDIDFFKRVNDTWGHAVGDEVLKHLAALLRKWLRGSDMAGRLGGEEFAVLLPNTDMDASLHVAEQLRQMVEKTPAVTAQAEIPFQISIGVSCFDLGLRTMDEGLQQADAALYYAKRNGRNRVCHWTPGMAMVDTQR